MSSYFNKFSLPEMPKLDYHSLNQGFMVAVGVTLAILASFITCLGLNLQKLSLCAPENENKSPWQQPKWVAGFTCVVVGSLIDFLAFGMASQSLLAPLAALSLVWNLSMASYLLNEQYNRIDVYAVTLIFAGTGITVAFANHDEQSFTLAELKSLYQEKRMMVYGFVVPLLLCLHYGMVYCAAEHKERLGLSTKVSNLMQMVGYAGFAGIVGGQSVLFAKSTVELIKSATQGDDVFLHIETYLIIIMMAGCLITQITFLNYGLKNFPSLVVVPVYQSYWIISGVVGGLVYFGEWEEMQNDPIKCVMFLLGTFVTLVGLFVLTLKDNHSMDNDTSLDRYKPVSLSETDFNADEGEEDDVEIGSFVSTTTGETTSQNIVPGGPNPFKTM